MHKIICVGSATKDIFFPTREGVVLETPEDLTAQRKLAFELGAKYHIAQRYESLGGCAVNVACGLARQGEHVGCYVAIGEDEIGRWIKQNLQAEKVQTGEVQVLAGMQSDLSAIVVAENCGERVIFSSHGASQLFKIEKQNLQDAQWLFVCDLSGNWQANLKVIFAEAKIQHSKIAFNPRQQMLHQDVQQVIAVLPGCEILFVNKDEAIELVKGLAKGYGDQALNDEVLLLRTLQSLGVHKVVLTDGERGAWAFDGKQMWHAEVVLQIARDTTGAGDAFASGFLGVELKGGEVVEALKWGIVNSSNCVKHYGGVAGLLTTEEILAEVVRVQTKKIEW